MRVASHPSAALPAFFCGVAAAAAAADWVSASCSLAPTAAVMTSGVTAARLPSISNSAFCSTAARAAPEDMPLMRAKTRSISSSSLSPSSLLSLGLFGVFSSRSPSSLLSLGSFGVFAPMLSALAFLAEPARPLDESRLFRIICCCCWVAKPWSLPANARRGAGRRGACVLAGAGGVRGRRSRRLAVPPVRAGPPPVHAAPHEPCDNQRLHLGCISAASRLISAASRLHLGYISAISRRTSRETISASLSRLACQKLYRISLMSSKVVKVPRMLTTSSLKLSAKRT